MTHGVFRVGLTGDFFNLDGSPVYEHFDLSPLTREAGLELIFLPTRAGDLIKPEIVEDLDALIVEVARIEASSLRPNGRLKLIARFGTGFDLVNVEACTAAGVAVTTTPDATAEPVATAILALILTLTLNLLAKDRLARLGEPGWAQQSAYPGVGLRGRALGSLGCGRIAQEMFRIVAPLGMRPLAHDPFVEPAAIVERGIEAVGLEELFSTADVVAVNCPLTPRTRGIVDMRLLSLMKPTSFLINTARGGIVDQVALTNVLARRGIAGAGLDVFEREPTNPDDPLMGFDNVVLGPHALAYTDACISAIGRSAIAAVLDVKNGRVPSTVLNRSVNGDLRLRHKPGLDARPMR